MAIDSGLVLKRVAYTGALAGTLWTGWLVNEGMRPDPHIPVPGDKVTICAGETRTPDGKLITMSHPWMSPGECKEWFDIRTTKEFDRFQNKYPNLPILGCDEESMNKSVAVIFDFIGNMGESNYAPNSSMYKNAMNRNWKGYCDSFWLYRFYQKKDCNIAKLPNGKFLCKGVATRAQWRVDTCHSVLNYCSSSGSQSFAP